MRHVIIAAMFALGACATAPPMPINLTSGGAAPAQNERRPPQDDLIVLALSGGGARAASFSLGVLEGLRDTRSAASGAPLIHQVTAITAVSGGAILAAYVGLHGEAGLDTFRAAYLDKNWRLNSLSAPTTWWRAARGGANAAHADWLDREVYGGARMGEMRTGPRIILNATDLANATPFAFTPLFTDALCSDVSGIRVADAVAASMAVPMVFRPVLLEAREGCAEPAWAARVAQDRDAPETARATAQAIHAYGRTQRYVHLTDGGVFDNFGLASLAVMRAAGPAPAPFSAREAVAARRILFLIVNSEYDRNIAWPNQATPPGGAETLISALDAATEASKRGALDALRASLDAMQRELITVRCGLEPRTARELGAAPGWSCADVSLSLEVLSLHDAGPDAPPELIHTSTEVSLPADTVTALIAAGRYAATHNAAVRALAR